jgi:hypothetical protein
MILALFHQQLRKVMEMMSLLPRTCLSIDEENNEAIIHLSFGPLDLQGIN